MCFLFLRWIEGTTHLSHTRKWFNMTHAPPEVILPLLIATGACKCPLLPQAYIPTSGIDTNLHFPAKKPLWSQSQATIGYGVPPAIPRVHHLLHCVPKKYLPLLFFFF